MIRKTVILPCSPERAFSLFTEEASQWWPADRRHTEDKASVISIEASGRFAERASDGSEVVLGVVRHFEPAKRLVLDWYPGTGAAQATQVEIRFEAVEAGTRVTVTHDLGAANRDTYTRNVPTYDRSWDALLAAWERHASMLP